MTLPRSLVLFLAFCGGGALFGAPLILAALALGGGSPREPETVAAASLPVASVAPDTDEIIGELTFTAFDLGFEPASVEVEQPGRYAVTFVNDGAIFHDLAFADGTMLEAEAGESVRARSSSRPRDWSTSARCPATPTAA